jgi:hypothetical protein
MWLHTWLCVTCVKESRLNTKDQLDYCTCWGLVLKCYELRTRQHKMLNINVLRPLKHYFPKDLMNFRRML